MNGWKLLGMAGLAGVAAAGVVVARRERSWSESPPDELRERLHQRLRSSTAADDASPAAVESGLDEA